MLSGYSNSLIYPTPLMIISIIAEYPLTRGVNDKGVKNKL